ncbi:MAG: response regulator [Candidatus Omnitrophica bacterium]|nr:response regulator [Candidatus Omnitrophota bacterium]
MGKKILLVDDEEDFLKVTSSRIESWGYEVISVANGKQALDAVMSKNPDIVILDYMMPEMDGIETLKRIRKINKKLPVIMFTAYPNEKAIEGAENLSVRAFIPKLSMYSDSQEALKQALKISEGRE